MVARFRRHYADPHLWRSDEYPTRDRLIPFGLFWIYYLAIEPNWAFERIQHAKAVSSAIALAFSKEKRVPDSVQKELAAAYLD